MADESAELVSGYYIPRGGRDPRARFWSFVEIRGSCWEWTGARQRGGYGHFQYRVGCNRGRQVTAHRFAWEFMYGPIPSGLHACHSCDNPLCVRPTHLWLGTDQDNSDDKFRKGRDNLAVRRWTQPSKGRVITFAEAEDIRRRVAMGQRYREVASLYGVSASMVSMIVRGKRWARHG